MALRPSDGLLMLPELLMRLIQLVLFAGQIVNDRHFGVTLERVKNAL